MNSELSKIDSMVEFFLNQKEILTYSEIFETLNDLDKELFLKDAMRRIRIENYGGSNCQDTEGPIFKLSPSSPPAPLFRAATSASTEVDGKRSFTH